MNRRLSWGVACLAVAIFAIGLSAQDKDKGKKDEPKKPPVPAPKVPDMKDAAKNLTKTGKIAGEIIHVETGKQSFRVKVPYTYSEFNRGAYNNILQQQIHYQQALAKRPPDINAARSHLLEIAKNQAQLYTVKQGHRDIPLEAHEKMAVRLPEPKTAFDEMGNVKKYTAKELDMLRGKDRFFDGEFSDIATGQIVEVTLIIPKSTGKPANKDDIVLEEPKIEATRVAVLRQPKVK